MVIMENEDQIKFAKIACEIGYMREEDLPKKLDKILLLDQENID